MHRTAALPVALAIAASSSVALGGVVTTDPSILAPFEFTEVSVEWIGSSAGYTGELDWIDPDVPLVSTTLFNNHQAVAGQSYTIPRLYAQGERVDFSYDIIRGSNDFFSTATQSDWSQFRVDDTNPNTLVVAIEDIRRPGGDSDFNDVMFRVRFSQSAIPAPGAMGLLAMSSVALIRRRRR